MVAVRSVTVKTLSDLPENRGNHPGRPVGFSLRFLHQSRPLLPYGVCILDNRIRRTWSAGIMQANKVCDIDQGYGLGRIPALGIEADQRDSS